MSMHKAKTGPKPKPPNEHYRRLTISLPPGLYKDLMAYVKSRKGEKISPITAELIEYSLMVIN